MGIVMRMREKFKYNSNKNNGSSFTKDLSNINRKQVILGSLTKLNPYYLAKNNAVMFTVEVGFVLVFAIGLALPTIPKEFASQTPIFYYEVAIILIVTVWFATFSEALSEAQAKARVDSLRSLRKRSFG